MADNTLRQNVQNLLQGVGGTRIAFLVQLAGKDIGKTYELRDDVVFIGRSPECLIHVDDDEVSRQHAKVVREAEGICVYDLQSTNGTLVNGGKIVRHLLEDGDRIQVGGQTVLKFNFQDELESTFNEELYNSANRDFLTQVYNKKYFVDRLRMEFSFAKRHNSPLAIIMFDVDHFKQINDQHGHLVGDEILKEVCKRIDAEKREEDVFARFGGEEFVILLRATDGNTAYLIAEKMRRVISDVGFKTETGEEKTVTVTISLGVASLDNQKCANMDELLLQADNQLYRAKRGGRNQTCREA